MSTTTTTPRPIDQVTGAATRVDLDVQRVDRWCVCTCTHDKHRETDLIEDVRWADGQYVYTPAWRTDRETAVRDLAYTPGDARHVVLRPGRLIVGALEVDL